MLKLFLLLLPITSTSFAPRPPFNLLPVRPLYNAPPDPPSSLSLLKSRLITYLESTNSTTLDYYTMVTNGYADLSEDVMRLPNGIRDANDIVGIEGWESESEGKKQGVWGDEIKGSLKDGVLKIVEPKGEGE